MQFHDPSVPPRVEAERDDFAWQFCRLARDRRKSVSGETSTTRDALREQPRRLDFSRKGQTGEPSDVPRKCEAREGMERVTDELGLWEKRRKHVAHIGTDGKFKVAVLCLR